jgi:hypothetical protein
MLFVTGDKHLKCSKSIITTILKHMFAFSTDIKIYFWGVMFQHFELRV